MVIPTDPVPQEDENKGEIMKQPDINADETIESKPEQKEEEINKDD